MSESRYFIDLDSYQQAGRSFAALVRNRLCPRSQKTLGAEAGAEAILATLKDCCSQAEVFFSPSQPLKESVFRLFLANGNSPLSLEEIAQELARRRGGLTPSPQALARLLASDHYYGLRAATQAEGAP